MAVFLSSTCKIATNKARQDNLCPYHHAPIMSVTSLPAAIEPFKWADRTTQVVVDVPLAKFSRLAADLVHTNGTVKLDCRFERDAQHGLFAW
jgi:hypothetical protein